jgi:transcriptional regulator with XRE-family HTH domain
MTFTEIVKRLQDRRIRVIAQATGLSEQTLSSIKNGHQTNPTLETLEKLMRYFEENK